MSTPEQVALKKAGDTLTMNVLSCAKVPVGTYPDYDFTGIDSTRRLVVVRVPESAMKRQFARIDLTTETVVGKTITFSRDPNASAPAKPYWGINLADVAIPTNGVAKTSTGKAGEIGAPIPGLDDDAPLPEPPEDAMRSEPAGEPAGESPARARLNAIFKLQEVCFSHALRLAAAAAEKGVPLSLEGVSALTAQSMIEANRKGVI
jgi:hypothetical protein